MSNKIHGLGKLKGWAPKACCYSQSHCNLGLPIEVDEVERLCLGRCALLPASRGDVVELARKEEDTL